MRHEQDFIGHFETVHPDFKKRHIKRRTGELRSTSGLKTKTERRLPDFPDHHVSTFQLLDHITPDRPHSHVPGSWSIPGSQRTAPSSSHGHRRARLSTRGQRIKPECDEKTRTSARSSLTDYAAKEDCKRRSLSSFLPGSLWELGGGFRLLCSSGSIQKLASKKRRIHSDMNC